MAAGKRSSLYKKNHQPTHDRVMSQQQQQEQEQEEEEEEEEDDDFEDESNYSLG